MKTWIIALTATVLLGGCATTSKNQQKDPPVITHSVFFKLKHTAGSTEETAFIEKAATLSSIPGVGNFQVLEETSPKNEYAFGLTMTFEDQAAYEHYNNHPEHVEFVQEFWLKEVESFQEIDHVPYSE